MQTVRNNSILIDARAAVAADSGSCRPMSGPVFVVGVWRSGTSLLYALLNQHPQIALLYEGDLPLLWPLFIGRKLRSALSKWGFWNDALKRHALDSGALPDQRLDLRAAVATVYREYARRKGARVWGCKSPTYYDALPFLARKFPGARFVVIWRHPADVARSILSAAETEPWFQGTGVMLRALMGHRRLQVDCQRLALRGVRIHHLRYEDLVRNPARVMEGVSQFLEVPFDARMANLEGADRSAVYKGEHHTLVNGRGIIRSGARGRELPTGLRAKIGRYLRLWLQQFGTATPLAAYASDAAAAPAGKWERARDRVCFELLRGLDRATRLTYCFTPLVLWKAYRRLKSRFRLPAGPEMDVGAITSPELQHK
jgi:hypothetical protein